MNTLAIPGNHLGTRPDWMPDPTVYRYVMDMIEDRFKIDTTDWPEKWVPLAIIGTLDWINICGWWIFKYTGFFETDEPYEFVFEYEGHEFDPDDIWMFRDDTERNFYTKRYYSPGVAAIERSECLPFVLDTFDGWEEGRPPSELVEVVMYATMMWVLSDNGRGWIYELDPMFSSIIDFGVAYWHRPSSALLNPALMVCTFREHASCRYCGQKTWCVKGYYINDAWQFICNDCAVELYREHVQPMDENDRRLRSPHCPHHGGACTSICQHSNVKEGDVWNAFVQAGTRRVEEHKARVVEAGGKSPRQLAQSADDVTTYFK